MEDDPEAAGDRRQTLQTIQMLREVIDGDPYATVAQRWGLSRSAVDRRIKGLAVQLTQVVGVDGLQESSAAFVKRLRMHRDAILQALGWRRRWTDSVSPALGAWSTECGHGIDRDGRPTQLACRLSRLPV